MLRLHTFPNTAGRAVMIALEEAGAGYDTVLVDFRADAQRKAGHLAINPKGRVPAIETPRGVLTETPAILTYLALAHPQAELLPRDPFLAAKAGEVMAFLAATMHVAHAHGRRAGRWADDPAAQAAMRSKMPANVAECCAHLETGWPDGPWAIGEGWSVADAHLFTVVGWIEGDGVSLAAYPRLAAHRAAMTARPAVARALAREAAMLG